MKSAVVAVLSVAQSASVALAFVPGKPNVTLRRQERQHRGILGAAPKRFTENVDGPLFVNEKVRRR